LKLPVNLQNLTRALLTFTCNGADYFMGTKSGRGPFFVSWDIDTVCNARCSYCFQWKKKEPELPLDKKLHIVEQLGSAGTVSLSLCGGEPLLMRGLDRVISAAKRSGMMVNISTNGFLLPEKSEMLLDAGTDYVTVSVDSSIAENQDSIRGCPGLFDRIISGIDMLKQAGGKRPHIMCRIVVSNLSCGELSETVGFWKDRADEVVLQPIHSSGPLNFNIPPEAAVSTENYEKFKNRFMDILRKHGMVNSYNEGIPDFLFNKIPERGLKCFSGFYFMEIDAAGNLYNCGEHLYRLGNPADTDLKTIIKKRDSGILKRHVKRRCRGCWYNCNIINIHLNHMLILGLYLVKYENNGY